LVSQAVSQQCEQIFGPAFVVNPHEVVSENDFLQIFPFEKLPIAPIVSILPIVLIVPMVFVIQFRLNKLQEFLSDRACKVSKNA
jgi:hypothetical protein